MNPLTLHWSLESNLSNFLPVTNLVSVPASATNSAVCVLKTSQPFPGSKHKTIINLFYENTHFRLIKTSFEKLGSDTKGGQEVHQKGEHREFLKNSKMAGVSPSVQKIIEKHHNDQNHYFQLIKTCFKFFRENSKVGPQVTLG
jgi:hypothetical protein